MRFLITLPFMFSLFIGCVSASRLENAEQERDQARAAAANLELERARMAGEIERLSTQLGELQKKSEETSRDIGALQSENESIRQETETVREEVRAERTRLEERIAALEAERDRLDAQSARLLAQLQRLQRSRAALDTGMDQAVEELAASLEPELKSGAVEIQRMDGIVRLSLSETAVFPSGVASLDRADVRILGNVAALLRRFPNMQFYVEGHTDSVKISGALARRYATNWELGAARAISVVRYLTEREGVDPRRIAAVTYGPHRPAASNDTRDGRAKNRRIEISLVRVTEPAAASNPTLSTSGDTEGGPARYAVKRLSVDAPRSPIVFE